MPLDQAKEFFKKETYYLKGKNRMKETNHKKFKKTMLLTPKNTAAVADYISELPIDKNFKITVEEI